MHFLQLFLSIFMMALPHIASAMAYVPANAMGLSPRLSGFVATPQPHTIETVNNYAVSTRRSASGHDGCYTSVGISHYGDDHEGLVSWSDLSDPYNETTYTMLNDTFKDLCIAISKQTLVQGQQSFHCKLSDSPKHVKPSLYSVIASMIYVGPDATFDMKGNHKYCMAAMTKPRVCEKGGYFSNVSIPWPDSKSTGDSNGTHFWKVRAQAIVAPCHKEPGGK